MKNIILAIASFLMVSMVFMSAAQADDWGKFEGQALTTDDPNEAITSTRETTEATNNVKTGDASDCGPCLAHNSDVALSKSTKPGAGPDTDANGATMNPRGRR